MARSAKVTSVDAVEALSNVMKRFQEERARNALESLGLEVQRAVGWVQHEQKDYWALQVRRGWEQLGEAKANLQRARTSKRVAGHEPSCIDEKRAVERARRRLQLSEGKVETVRHWTRIVDRAVIEYQGCVGQVAGWLDTDCHRAVAALERISEALRSYVALQSTADGAMADALPAARAAGVGLSGDDASPEKREEEEPAPAADEDADAEEKHARKKVDR